MIIKDFSKSTKSTDHKSLIMLRLITTWNALIKAQGKLDEAIFAYNKALSIKPDYADAYNNMGNALKDQSKLEDAIEAYKKALSIKPDYADAYNNMGNVLQNHGKLEEVMEAYKKLSPLSLIMLRSIITWVVLSKSKANSVSKPDMLIEAYNKALSIKPDYAEAYNNMGFALKTVTFNDPNRDLQKTIVFYLMKDNM